MGAKVVGASVDHVPCLTAWAESLGGIGYPLVSDFWPHGETARAYGVFRDDDGHSERAVFVIDAEGRIAYVDVHDIDDQPDNEVLFAELAKVAASPDPGPSVAAVGASESGGLVMYCTPWCPDCRRAREWLKQRGVTYTEIDVSSDPAAREQAASFNEGKLHTPTFQLDDDICVDFKPDRLEELLGT